MNVVGWVCVLHTRRLYTTTRKKKKKEKKRRCEKRNALFHAQCIEDVVEGDDHGVHQLAKKTKIMATQEGCKVQSRPKPVHRSVEF